MTVLIQDTRHSNLSPLDSILELRKESAQCVVIQGCKNQLGIRIVGGRNIVSETESDFGIFIKEVLPNSLASEDGVCAKKSSYH